MIDSKAAVMMVSALVGAIVCWAVVYGWGKWLQRPRPELQLQPIDQDARMQRIEHAVEAIALEVERLGEGQRHTTRLLTERERLLSATPAVPVHPARSITPH